MRLDHLLLSTDLSIRQASAQVPCIPRESFARAGLGRHPFDGAIAQLGEHLLCKQGVVGSIPTGSTTLCDSLAGARTWVCGLPNKGL